MDVYLYTCTWCTHLVPFFEGYLRLAMFPSNFVNYTPRLLVSQSPCPCPCRCSLPWTASSWAPVVGSPSRKARPSGSARGWVCSSQLRCGRSYFPQIGCAEQNRKHLSCVYGCSIFSRKLMEHDQNSLDLMFLRQNGRFLLVVSQPPVAQWQQLPRIILDDEAEQLKLCYQVHGPSTILWRMSTRICRIAETIWQQILEIDLEIFGMKNP